MTRSPELAQFQGRLMPTTHNAIKDPGSSLSPLGQHADFPFGPVPLVVDKTVSLGITLSQGTRVTGDRNGEHLFLGCLLKK